MMSTLSRDDARMLKAFGIDPNDKPEPMVSGERYARQIQHNDALTTMLHQAAAENEFLRAQIAAKERERAEAAFYRPPGKIAALLTVFWLLWGVAGWILWLRRG